MSLIENNNSNKSLLKIEVDDISNYFISYWNKALKKLLSNYNCVFNSDFFGDINIALNNINMKLVNANNTLDNNFEDKLFLIKVYFLNSEKELSKDFFNNIKNTYNDKNFNLILISTTEIKKEENIQKNCVKILNKIKSKTGLNDLYYLPYNIINFDKININFIDFLNSFSSKFSKEFLAKINLLKEKLENFGINEEQNIEEDYKCIEDCIYHLDLLSQINCWNIIVSFCEKIMMKEFGFFKDKICMELKPLNISNFDETKIKLNYVNKSLSNVDFNEFILYQYISSSQSIKKYNNIIRLIKLLPNNMKIFIKNFKTEFHYIYWMINYIYIFIDYFTKLKENNSINKIEFNKNINFLMFLCIKYYKEFISKINKKNFFIPNKNILLELINNIKNNNCENINEDLEKLLKEENNNEIKNEQFNIFINDISENIKNNDKVSLLLNDNKKILNVILDLYKSIRTKFSEYANITTSIQFVFDEIYLLILFHQFEQIKQILVSLLEHKFFKKNQFRNIYEYICFILLIILNYLEKNKENLNLVFKLLNIDYNKNPLINRLLSNIIKDNKNIIYEIISNYIETYKSNSDDKEEIIMNLDNILDINLFSGENKNIFINKAKNGNNNIETLEYKITNKTGIELNIDKIIIKFKEFNIIEKEESNIFMYEINNDKNTFKRIEPYINQKNELVQIEINDIFKINNIYKPVEIQYILKNLIKAVYHIKENIELIFNNANINIKAELCSNEYYFNILSILNLNISNITNISEINDKYLIINLNNINNNGDSILKIQTELAKNNLNNIFKNIIIKDNNITLPPDSITDIKDLNTLEIPFFLENTDYYDITKESKIELIINIKQSQEYKESIFSYYKLFTPKFSHLFTIGKRFKKIQKMNSYLMQTFLSLNLLNIKVTIYNNDNKSTIIDSKQAINMILILGEKENEIINKLRKNYIKFSLSENKDIKYHFCYPEKNIIEEIKDMKEIPYHIKLNVVENNIEHLIYNEICVKINIKKYKNKKIKFMINIKDNELWSVVGASKIIEELDEGICEKELEIILLPLIDGLLPLPEIEFNECDFSSNSNNQFEPIEYNSIIEGIKNTVKIIPFKEYNLKINLT